MEHTLPLTTIWIEVLNLDGLMVVLPLLDSLDSLTQTASLDLFLMLLLPQLMFTVVVLVRLLQTLKDHLQVLLQVQHLQQQT